MPFVKHPLLLIAGWWGTLLATAVPLASGQTVGRPVNLLRLPSVKVERTSLVGQDAEQVPRLNDGDLTTTARLPATPPATVEKPGTIVAISIVVARSA